MRRRAASVLALTAPPTEVLRLLNDPDSDVRTAARRFVNGNPSAPEIAAMAAATTDRLNRPLLRDHELSRLARAVAALAQTPASLRGWRAAMILNRGEWSGGARFVLGKYALEHDDQL
jgi:hypothetical protein